MSTWVDQRIECWLDLSCSWVLESGRGEEIDPVQKRSSAGMKI
jgi:hypothetical protein